MQQFKISQSGIKEIQKKALIRTIFLMSLMLIFAAIISSVNTGGKAGDVNILPIIIPLFAIVFGVSIYIGLKKSKKLLESYILTVTSNLIIREQFNTPTVSIYVNELKEIVQKGGNLAIKGKDSEDIIYVSRYIENYDQLEIRLKEIIPIVSNNSKPFYEKYRSLLPVLSVVLMLGVYAVDNKLIVTICGVIVSVQLILSFKKIQKSKNIDEKTRRSTWWIILVLVSVIGVVLAKLFGLR